MNNKVALRVTIYLIGVILMALGFILNAKSTLGISPICAVAYCVSYITGLTFPDMTMCLFAILFFAAIILRGTKPHWTDFLQLPYCFVFTRCMSAFAAILPSPDSLAIRIIFLACAILCIGTGATITLSMHIIPNPGDYFVNVFAVKINKPLGLAKNIVDISIVAITVIIALLFDKNIMDAGVGPGTLATMLLTGRWIAVVNHFFREKMQNLYKSAPIRWLDSKQDVEVAR